VHAIVPALLWQDNRQLETRRSQTAPLCLSILVIASASHRGIRDGLGSNGDSCRPLILSLSSDRSQVSSTFCGQNYRWVMKTGGQTLKALTAHRGTQVHCIAFSPDGRQLVSGSSDNYILLRDAQKCSLVHTFKGHADGVWTVAFSPDGNLIASGSSDSTIRLWGHHNSAIHCSSSRQYWSAMVGYFFTQWHNDRIGFI